MASYSRGSSSSSGKGEIDLKAEAQNLINTVDRFARQAGVGSAGTYQQIQEIQENAWRQALAQLKKDYEDDEKAFVDIAKIARAPGYY